MLPCKRLSARAGHRTLEAQTLGKHQLLEKGEHLNVVFSDVQMPGAAVFAGLHRGLQVGEIGDAILPNEADFAGLKFRRLSSFDRLRERDVARILEHGGSIMLSFDDLHCSDLSRSNRQQRYSTRC
jgi:hypothetical protein